jgi:hypothetical protein
MVFRGFPQSDCSNIVHSVSVFCLVDSIHPGDQKEKPVRNQTKAFLGKNGPKLSDFEDFFLKLPDLDDRFQQVS